MRSRLLAPAAFKSFKMPNKMLIDATHPEETRVVVVRGNRVEEFDFETAQRKQLRGNIYLAKVTRVEPSLQAAFVEYGGNRHGFLAFSEIHPDYYQIPVADRQALIEAEERAHREAEEENENRASRRRSRHRSSRRRGYGDRVQSDVIEGATADLAQDAAPIEGESPDDNMQAGTDALGSHEDVEHYDAPSAPHDEADHSSRHEQDTSRESTADEITEAETSAAPQIESAPEAAADLAGSATVEAAAEIAGAPPQPEQPDETLLEEQNRNGDHEAQGDELPTGQTSAGELAPEYHDEVDSPASDEEGTDEDEGDESEEEVVESVGGDDALEEVLPERPYRPRRQYKIQEVIKRRQVMLVQVVKEERGNKGAALTTYLSLAGRYAVLMPNTARGGGISRKITSAQDRARLKDVVQELDVPEGMGIILRTAGAARSKQEIKRDFEYLIRMWETVRDLTLRSQAPTLVYEEGSLIKRSLRDLYNKEIDEIIVAGEAGYREARDFMKMLMPSNVQAVKLYREGQPLFSRMGVESQLDAMFSPTVQLRSGGYIVINQTEALVSIDVNSGRSTREHHIEDTALKTNLEAAEEVARQLRLRDLAGLIVIDFIDMDEKRNNRAVERKLSDCLRQDRARIQVGRISHFGLLEMSRQRIRASVLESSTEPCPQCGGTGHVRSVSSVALQLLRGLEEILMKGATHNLVVRTRTDVALYVLNHKRGHLRDLESSFKITLSVIADPTVSGLQSYVIDRGDQVHTLEAAKALLAAQAAATPSPSEEVYEEEEPFDIETESEVETEETEGLADEPTVAEATEGASEAPRRRRRRRRRGRSGGEARDGAVPREEGESTLPETIPIAGAYADEAEPEDEAAEGEAALAHAEQQPGERRPRRRGRRGGRRRRGGDDGLAGSIADELAPLSPFEASEAVADFDGVSESTTTASQAETGAQATHSPSPEQSAPEPTSTTAGSEENAREQDKAEPEKAARRRSTVREKVNFLMNPQRETNGPGSDSPESGPIVTASPSAPEPAEAATEKQTRRAGWWSRRFGGGE
jgi:ribonuclease E